MKAVLLIGGMATRLMPLSKYMPKSLLPVCDREVLHYQISQIAQAGINEIVLAAGHMVDQLASYVSGYYGGLEFSVSTEPDPMGTAGAIAYAAKQLGNEPVLVLNADIISSVNVSEVIRCHQQAGRIATIVGQKVKDPSRFGLLDVDGNSVTGFTEKPGDSIGEGPHYINAGMYILEPEVVNSIPTGRSVSIERETFPALLQEYGSLTHFPADDLWADIGTFESYMAASFKLLARRYEIGEEQVWGQRDDCAIFKDLVYLNKSTVLGKSVDLFHRVVAMSGVQIGDNCKLTNTILMPGSVIEAGSEVSDCIIGPGVTVRRGKTGHQVIIANEQPQPFYPEAIEIN